MSPSSTSRTLTFNPDNYNDAQTFNVYVMEDAGDEDPGKVFNMAPFSASSSQ